MRILSLGFGLSALVGLSAAAFATSISPLMCSNPGSTTASSTDNTVNANSCTDFSYSYPNNQAVPLNNWMYGFYQGTSATLNPAGFTTMTQQLPAGQGGWWAVDFFHLWTSLDAFGGHPNSPITDYHQAPYCDPVLGNCGSGPDTNPAHAQDFKEQWAVRRYIVPTGFDGLLEITLSVQKDFRTNSVGSDGDTNMVIRYSGGVATTLGTIAVPADATAFAGTPDATTFAVQTLVLDVAVHPGDVLDFAITPNSNDFSDGEFQLITIQAIPEPGTMLLVAGGLLVAGCARRKYSRPS
jgi:PEP-CTERM motif